MVTLADSILISTAPSPYPFVALSRSDTFMAGLGSGILARTLVYPCDVVKLLVQVDSEDRGFGLSCQDLYHRGGIRAFWTGNLVSIVNQGFYTGIKFFVIKEMRSWFGSEIKTNNWERAFTGALAGVVAQTALYPMDFLRTRMIVYPNRYTSFFQATARVAQEEGFLSLWTGLTPTIVGSIPYEGSQYLVYDRLREMYVLHTQCRHVRPFANAVLGGIAGIVSQSVAYPFETVRKLMMLTDLSGHKIYRSMTECFLKVYETEGMNGFFKGLGLNTLKVIPFSALQYTLYDETCKAILWLRRVQREGII
jgi:hypothetical protein